jgi:hypothetical protein
MPKFYEEAAHLLLLIIGRGVVVTPGVDHHRIVRGIAIEIERILMERPSHADAAISLLDKLSASCLASFEMAERTRLVALVGTAIGNLMTMTKARP